HARQHVVERVRLADVLEALTAARKRREIAALEGRLHLAHPLAFENLEQRVRLEITEDLIAVRVVAAMRQASVGEDDDPGEECALHAAVELAVEIGLLVDVER